jgi:uncharacterized protein YecE (DUF72 family)
MARAIGDALGHATIRTGTMGWSYEDWRGVFYTTDLPASRMLEQYARVFSTVELDTTFYGAPRASTLDGWAAHVPDDFRFSAKVPRAITHERRLVGAAEAALDFGRLLQKHLGSKIAALLLQLPPDFSADDDREVWEAFVDGIVSARSGLTLPWFVEFRHPSWVGAVDDLATRGITCATSERLDVGTPLRYLRLLGTENSVARFDERQFDRSAELDLWAKRVDDARRQPNAPAEIFVYARNFYEGHSPATLLALRDRLGLPLPTPPGKQQMSLF